MLRKDALKAILAAVSLSGAVLAAGPAQAGASTGTWRNGMVAGPYGPGYYGSGRGPRDYGDDYRDTARYEQQDCYMLRRRFVDPWGRVVVRRERVCE